MKFREHWAAVSCWEAVSWPTLSGTEASAQAATAQAFVETLYRPYLTKGSEDSLTTRTARFFVLPWPRPWTATIARPSAGTKYRP